MGPSVPPLARCLRLSRVRPLGHRRSVECSHLRANHLRCWAVASAAHSFAFPRLVGLSCRCAVDPVDQVCILCHVGDDIHLVRNLVVDPDRQVSHRRQADGSALGRGVHRPGLSHSVYWPHGDSRCSAALAPPPWRCPAQQSEALRGVCVDFSSSHRPVDAAQYPAVRRTYRSQASVERHLAGDSERNSRRSVPVGTALVAVGYCADCRFRVGGDRFVGADCSRLARVLPLEAGIVAAMEFVLSVWRLCVAVPRSSRCRANGNVRRARRRPIPVSCVYSASVRWRLRAG